MTSLDLEDSIEVVGSFSDYLEWVRSALTTLGAKILSFLHITIQVAGGWRSGESSTPVATELPIPNLPPRPLGKSGPGKGRGSRLDSG
ncbi:hypothetical protein KI387_005238, partial [Taxus chinensis]